MANILMIAPLNAANFDSGNAEAGKVLTADGSGGAAFEAVVGGDDDWLIDALGGGRHTPTSTATGGNAFAAGTNNEASGQRAVVGGGNSNTASGSGATVGGGYNNTASADLSAILGGNGSNTGTFVGAMIAGSGITASLANALHCNKLVVTQIPVASAGLPSGTVWSDGGTLKIIP